MEKNEQKLSDNPLFLGLKRSLTAKTESMGPAQF
jgi:hypothetical protein